MSAFSAAEFVGGEFCFASGCTEVKMTSLPILIIITVLILPIKYIYSNALNLKGIDPNPQYILNISCDRILIIN